ncbi:MAG: ribonuclease HII [Rickettsiales bacterium]|jgi:ribonuclease HII|nr:ribonuclease HII [Rickettsiales bacterium]
MPDFEFEDQSLNPVAGFDEAGRGPWAGPVVASAVILPRNAMPASLAAGLDDSKKIKKEKREELFAHLRAIADIGIGIASPTEIDEFNILQATMLAMQRAADELTITPKSALIDGNRAPNIPFAVKTIVRGDGQSLSIAAASIVAKVTRDRIMVDLSNKYPEYGWDRNAGYGTKEHHNALLQFGVTPEHRQTFTPIRKLLTISSKYLTS